MENLQHMKKIWIEFNQISPKLGQDKKKTQAYTSLNDYFRSWK